MQLFLFQRTRNRCGQGRGKMSQRKWFASLMLCYCLHSEVVCADFEEEDRIADVSAVIERKLSENISSKPPVPRSKTELYMVVRVFDAKTERLFYVLKPDFNRSFCLAEIIASFPAFDSLPKILEYLCLNKEPGESPLDVRMCWNLFSRTYKWNSFPDPDYI